MSKSPREWQTYISLVNAGVTEQNQLLSIFRSRYRPAKSFNGMNADNISSKTLGPYDAVLKIGLSYAALESIETFLQLAGNNTKTSVSSPEFLEWFRTKSADKLVDLIVD